MTCKESYCNRPVHCRGWCQAHYIMVWSGRTPKPIGKYHFLTDADAALIVKEIQSGATTMALADALDTVPSTICRIYQRTTGQSIRQYKASQKAGGSR